MATSSQQLLQRLSAWHTTVVDRQTVCHSLARTQYAAQQIGCRSEFRAVRAQSGDEEDGIPSHARCFDVSSCQKALQTTTEGVCTFIYASGDQKVRRKFCLTADIFNPLKCRDNYSATSNDMKTGRWWVGCYIWYSEEGPRPLLPVSNVTAHPSTVSVPITVLQYIGPLLCGFNARIKGLKQPDYWCNCWHTSWVFCCQHILHSFIPDSKPTFLILSTSIDFWYPLDCIHESLDWTGRIMFIGFF